MFCGKCGAEVLDGAKFCDKCGVAIGTEQVFVKEEKIDVKSAFIDPDEQLVEKIGNGYFINLLYSKVKDCNLLLTDKRVYLKGSFFDGGSKFSPMTREERIIDIEDVTGTGFIYESIPWLVLILDVLFTVVSFVVTIVYGPGADALIIPMIAACLGGVLLAVKIFMSRKILFFIEYAGGRILIDAKLIGLEDVRDFHKQMRRVKDNIKGKIS